LKHRLLRDEKQKLSIQQKEQLDARILATRMLVLPERLTKFLKTIERKMVAPNLSEEEKLDLETQKQQIMSDLAGVKEGKPSVYIAQARRTARAKRHIWFEKNGLTPTPLALTEQVKRAEKSIKLLSATISRLNTGLDKLIQETGIVLEKPQEQVRLEMTIKRMNDLLQQQQDKVARIAEYNKKIGGFEDEYKLQELKWQTLVKKLGFTREERRAASIAQYGERATGNTNEVNQAESEAKDIVEDAAIKAQEQEADEIQSTKKKLPESSDLPGGLHAVGKINDRARQNVEKAMKEEQKAMENEKEVEQVKQSQEEKEKSGGLFGWFKN